jgi:hypothetical protein
MIRGQGYKDGCAGYLVRKTLSQLQWRGIDLEQILAAASGKAKIVNLQIGPKGPGIYLQPYGGRARLIERPLDQQCGWICSIGLATTQVLGCDSSRGCVMEAALLYTPGGGSLRLARWTERLVRIAKESKAAKKLVKAGAAGKKLAGAARKGKRAEKATVVADEIANSGRWVRTQFKGSRVYQRDDLINPSTVDRFGRTNVERMRRGLAPIGPDGNPINLHHLAQGADSGVAEVTQTLHQQYSSILHINPSSVPSGINRAAFAKWRTEYWRWRSSTLK